jgi:hypothetical protein
MEKKRRFLRPHFLVLLAFLSSSPGLNAIPTVVWHGAVVSSVLDSDLQLDAGGGDIMMPAFPITVTAASTDITITVTTADVTVEGTPIVGSSCLSLIADPGFSITLDLTANPYDLTFLGSPNVALSPFPIFIQGTVNVLLNGGRTLTFGSDATHGGTQCYVIMQPTPFSALSFQRSDTSVPDTFQDINLVLDANCVLSYAAAAGDTTSDAAINFCTANTGTGRFVFTINDLAAFIVQGCTFTPVFEECTTVDLSSPSGGIAQWNVNLAACPANPFAGPTPNYYLTVANNNAHYPQLLSDPFFTLDTRAGPTFLGSFNGNLRYGAVIGANGVLHVDDNAYLDYVGLSNNLCPSLNCIPNINCSSLDLISSFIPNCPCGTGVEQLIALRNPSALIIDGWFEPSASPASIILGVQSGIFFRSGVDAVGDIENPTHPNIYTIEPIYMTPGSGEIVFDVEGPLNVTGSNVGDTYNSRMEILSLQVHQTFPMGPLFPDPGFVGPDLFPIRTFAVDVNDDYLQYNKAAWFINNVMSVSDASIAHTDELHLVCQSNDIISEATYLGGETWTLGAQMTPPFTPTIPRPDIEFFNARLHFYTSAAFTGVDLAVPDLVVADVEFTNLSKFIFYSNGRVIDNGTGRTLILGTLVGSQACDGCTVISRDAHLNVMQTVDFTSVDGTVVPCEDESLWFTVSTNTNLITEAIGASDIIGQTSIHEIYFGGNSNDSIGENAAPSCVSAFTMSSTPSEWIAGNYFNFSTRGGSVGIPDTSNVTGQGGIFVDLNGTFGIFPQYRASISAMVTKSCSTSVACGPQIQLPASQVVFANRIAVADWQLMMSGPETIIIPAGQVYSEYTLDWVSVIKDFVESGSETAFIPYEIGNVNMCGCPPVIPANITSLPTIMGTVNQLQIVDSRIGDAASIMIDGGYVRELLWLSNCRPAEAPVAIVAIQNGGRLGFNTANRNVDSINAETTFGVNGVTLIANGNGRIDLNADAIINNVCAILQGPDWTSSDILEFRADASRAIHVTAGGILDLRSFTNGGIIRIGENIRLVFEPGSTLILGGVALELNENASIEWEASPQAAQYFLDLDATVGPINNALNPLVSYDITTPHPLYAPLTNYGTGLHNTDQFRSHIYGVGVLRLRDRSQSFMGVGAVTGLETLRTVLPGDVVCTIPTTNLTLELDEGVSWQIGFGNNDEGGSFQIGNVQENSTEGNPHTISFTLNLNGPDATFVMGSGGFFGMGAGIVRPTAHDEPQSMALADTLFDVTSITFNNIQGSFQEQRIFNSDDSRSQSLVIGNVTAFNLLFAGQGDDPVTLDTDNFGIYGGGNLFQLVPGTDVGGNLGAVHLINLTDDDVINIPVTGGPSVPDARLFAGILASTDMMDNLNVSGLTPATFFQTMKATSATLPTSRSNGFSTIAPLDPLAFRESRTSGILGYVDRGFIGRVLISNITPQNGVAGGSQADLRARAYDIGAVLVGVRTDLPAPGPVTQATQIYI